MIYANDRGGEALKDLDIIVRFKQETQKEG